MVHFSEVHSGRRRGSCVAEQKQVPSFPRGVKVYQPWAWCLREGEPLTPVGIPLTAPAMSDSSCNEWYCGQ